MSNMSAVQVFSCFRAPHILIYLYNSIKNALTLNNNVGGYLEDHPHCKSLSCPGICTLQLQTSAASFPDVPLTWLLPCYLVRRVPGQASPIKGGVLRPKS